MKRTLHILGLLFMSLNIFAQAPQKMSYQAVIRNAQNELVANKPVKMRISILQGSASGTAVYSELHSATTNANGLATIEIGAGTSPTGTFSSINWGNGPYFLKTETDPNNGSTYSIVGTSQLLSVPYALESKNSETAKNAGNGIKEVSKTGDTVYLDNGKKYIIPGIKDISPSTTINNGLIAFYPFNGNANDESGNNNNGTVNGPVLTTDRYGNPNKAYIYNGNNQRIITTSSILPITPTNYTISFWVYNIGSIPSGELICDRSSQNFSYKYRVILRRIDLQNSIEFVSADESNNFVYGTRAGTFIQENWTHVIAAGNVIEKTMRLYINGILIGNSISPDFSNNIVYPIINNPTTFGANIGPSQPGEPDFDNSFIGKLDDIRFYNRILTQEEITWLANN